MAAELLRDALGRRARENVTTYDDDGCDIWAHCLSCPLKYCRYDVPVRQQASQITLEKYADLRAQGYSIGLAATVLGITPRSGSHLEARLRELNARPSNSASQLRLMVRDG